MASLHITPFPLCLFLVCVYMASYWFSCLCLFFFLFLCLKRHPKWEDQEIASKMEKSWDQEVEGPRRRTLLLTTPSSTLSLGQLCACFYQVLLSHARYKWNLCKVPHRNRSCFLCKAENWIDVICSEILSSLSFRINNNLHKLWLNLQKAESSKSERGDYRLESELINKKT